MDKLHYIDAHVVCLLSKLNTYDYIIVGSGFGGGPIANDLARKKKRVLLIERGEVIFSTHVLNTSRPYYGRGASNSPEGNETIYDSVKAKVECTEGSEAYVGGPVYCIGGRSNLWGIWTPEISSQTLEKYFPPEVVSYLNDGGYTKAFNFMTQNSQESEFYPISSGQVSPTEIGEIESSLQKALPDVSWDLMPVAAEFNSPAPYKFPQGAYSTTLALMNRIFAKDQYLTVLLDTEVLSVEHSKTENPQDSTEERKVYSIKIRNGADRAILDLPVGNAKVIISAGTIGTASIALNSGFQQLNAHVGKGIIDHDIFYVRFSMEKEETMKKPLNLKTHITIDGRLCLLTVTVNANFFLAGSNASLPSTHFYNKHGRLIDDERRRQRYKQGDFDTIAILFEFVADLQDSNEVLNLASVNPVLSITRPPLSNAVNSGIEEYIEKIRNQFVYNGDAPPPGIPIPQPSHMGFGVFAHECGTMRMDGPKGNSGVVDSNLKMKGFENLWICDLSVFPVCPEANPALTLAALSFRMADQFVPDQPDLPPIGPPET